jgi:hypothetical protein
MLISYGMNEVNTNIETPFPLNKMNRYIYIVHSETDDPVSSVLVETYLQYLKFNQVIGLLNRTSILLYAGYP